MMLDVDAVDLLPSGVQQDLDRFLSLLKLEEVDLYVCMYVCMYVYCKTTTNKNQCSSCSGSWSCRSNRDKTIEETPTLRRSRVTQWDDDGNSWLLWSIRELLGTSQQRHAVCIMWCRFLH
jgi:hypothetical protein